MTNPSFKNRTWTVGDPSPDAIQALADAGGLSPLEAKVLASRGLAPSALAEFLDPKLRAALPNPSFFQGMEAAVDRLIRAIVGDEIIAIWSDYDVDGACSGAILARFLRDAGVTTVLMRIPDRVHEGYGPNTPGLQALQAQGATLVCILDSGTTAFEPLEAASAMGLDVIVVDHHIALDTLPPAVAVVNPNRRDQAPGFGHVCAAGMTFFVAMATNAQLRLYGRPSVDINPLTGLVALATVCDVVALKGVNRAFVAQGLKRLSQRTYPGVASLADAAGIDGAITARDCGFGLGPRINAGGRIGAADLGVRLLMSDDADEAHAIAVELDMLNKRRRELGQVCTHDALAQTTQGFIPGVTRALAVAVVDSPEGIVGISAAKVKEENDAPAFVLTAVEDGLLKGSGRSVEGFDLGAAVVQAAQAGLLVKGGGHAMAAGITIHPDKLDAFTAFVNDAIATSSYARNGLPLYADASITAREVTVDWVQGLDRLGPFGAGHENPCFVLRNVRVVGTQIFKDKATGKPKHVKLQLQDASRTGPRLDAPLWSGWGTPLAARFEEVGDAPLDVVCSMEINRWKDTVSVRICIHDARLSVVTTTTHTENLAVPF